MSSHWLSIRQVCRSYSGLEAGSESRRYSLRMVISLARAETQSRTLLEIPNRSNLIDRPPCGFRLNAIDLPAGLMKFRALVIVTALVGLLACGASVSDNGTPPNQRAALVLGAESPAGVVERITLAAHNKDIRELAASIDPQQLDEMAEGLAFISAMILAFSTLGDEATFDTDSKAQELNTIMTRHGLPAMNDGSGDDEAPTLQDALAALDQVSMINLIIDLASFLEELGENDEGLNNEFLPPFDGELTDLVIDGATATARVGDENVDFVRVDQRWYARMPEPPQAAADSSEASEFWSDWDNRNRAGAEQATELVLPISGEHALDDNGRHWYRFSAPETGTLRLATRASGSNDGDLVIEAYLDEVFDFSVARSDADRDGDPAKESIEIDLQAGQVLHVKVSQWGVQQDALSYHFEASFSLGDE